MITREQIQELAQFEDQGNSALSFYFQPTAPRNKAHKEEAILTKDLAREALRHLESKGCEGNKKGSEVNKKDKCETDRASLDRIVRMRENLGRIQTPGMQAGINFTVSNRIWLSC